MSLSLAPPPLSLPGSHPLVSLPPPQENAPARPPGTAAIRFLPRGMRATISRARALLHSYALVLPDCLYLHQRQPGPGHHFGEIVGGNVAGVVCCVLCLQSSLAAVSVILRKRTSMMRPEMETNLHKSDEFDQK